MIMITRVKFVLHEVSQNEFIDMHNKRGVKPSPTNLNLFIPARECSKLLRGIYYYFGFVQADGKC